MVVRLHMVVHRALPIVDICLDFFCIFLLAIDTIYHNRSLEVVVLILLHLLSLGELFLVIVMLMYTLLHPNNFFDS